MTSTKRISLERVPLKGHPVLNEKWVQQQLAEDPSLLGIGDLVLRDKERPQPQAGRLDLLLQDAELPRRFEVEVQLGRTDESHIIRAIEYWDIERKRYPQYEHCAVIVAEEITSRFLNVIGLFNGQIPLIALQMAAYQTSEGVALTFVKVLDQLELGLVDEDEQIQEVADRAYWEQRATKSTVQAVDELLGILKAVDPTIALKYNKYYIGLERDGRPDNFVIFRPKKKQINIEIRLPKTKTLDQQLESAEIDVLEYDTRWNRYRLRVDREEIAPHATLLTDVLRQAFEASR